MKKFRFSLAQLVFIFLGCVMVFPFVYMVSTSMKSTEEFLQNRAGLWPQRIHFENYPLAFSTGDWGRYFFNSAMVSGISVLISLVINTMAGYAFARLRFRGRDGLFKLTLVGMMMPAQVTMIPVFLLLKNIPLAGGNNLWGQGGLGLINTHAGVMMPYIAGALGVFLTRQYFLNFPRSLDEAAKIDGLSPVGTLLHIYLPLCKPILTTLVLLKVTQTWNDYAWPLIILQSKPLQTVQLALSLFREETLTKWNLMMAATTVITLPLLLLSMFTQKYYVQGIVSTGIKG